MECINGARASPPEVCGGIWGYEDLLEALKDPRHKGHQSTVEWLGEEFDPEAFSVDETNSCLHSL